MLGGSDRVLLELSAAEIANARFLLELIAVGIDIARFLLELIAVAIGSERVLQQANDIAYSRLHTYLPEITETHVK